MSYITYEELVLRYDTIADWAASPALVNSGLIHYAEIELNSLLSTHFAVPFSDSHPTVKDLAMDLAYYKSLVTRDPEKAEQIKDAVIGRIDRIKEGNEFIYTGSGTTIQPDLSNAGFYTPYEDYIDHPVFSMLDAEHPGSEIDSSYLNELENERIF